MHSNKHYWGPFSCPKWQVRGPPRSRLLGLRLWDNIKGKNWNRHQLISKLRSHEICLPVSCLTSCLSAFASDCKTRSRWTHTSENSSCYGNPRHQTPPPSSALSHGIRASTSTHSRPPGNHLIRPTQRRCISTLPSHEECLMRKQDSIPPRTARQGHELFLHWTLSSASFDISVCVCASENEK